MLTVKELRAIKPNVWLSDGGGRGGGSLVFRRTGDGVIRTYFRHVQSDGKRYALPIGQYDEAGRDGLTLAQARARAGELSKLYQSGVKNLRAHFEAEDAERRAAQNAAQAAREAAEAEANARRRYTLKALCGAYISYLERAGKAKSAKDAASCFKVHVYEAFPKLVDIPAREITPHQIAAMVRTVREAGKERTAGVLRANLRAAYSLAVRAPFDSAVPSDLIGFAIESNPVDAIPTIPVRAGHRTLSPAELGQYLARLGDGVVDQALKLALLAGGQRMAQLLRAHVNDYEPAQGTLRLWDGKGKRNKPREHLLPLGATAAALVDGLVERAKRKAIESAQRDGGDAQPNPLLFVSVGGAGIFATTPGKRVAQIVADMKCEPFNLRDVRRTVETMLAALKVSREVRAQLLSHGLSGVQNLHYDRHTYMDEKRAALLVWEHHLETIAGGAITFVAGGYAEGEGERDEAPNALADRSMKRRRATSGQPRSPRYLAGPTVRHRPTRQRRGLRLRQSARPCWTAKKTTSPPSVTGYADVTGTKLKNSRLGISGCTGRLRTRRGRNAWGLARDVMCPWVLSTAPRAEQGCVPGNDHLGVGDFS